jgi:uncharacterized protein (DUF4415 family)
MSEENIIRGSRTMKSRTDWARIDAMKDEDIDYSDCPPLDEKFWENAKLIMPESKIPIGARFDKEVVDWFKKQGPGYQSKMNAVLKTYIAARKSQMLKQKSKKKAS